MLRTSREHLGEDEQGTAIRVVFASNLYIVEEMEDGSKHTCCLSCDLNMKFTIVLFQKKSNHLREAWALFSDRQ